MWFHSISALVATPKTWYFDFINAFYARIECVDQISHQTSPKRQILDTMLIKIHRFYEMNERKYHFYLCHITKFSKRWFNSFLICKVKWSWFHFKAIEAWKWRYSNNKIIIILRPNKEINHRKMFGKVKSKKPQALNINRMVVASRIWFCLYVWNLNFLAILQVYFWVPSRLLNSIA